MIEFIRKLRWRPEIGDPTVMGWVTVGAYGVAAFLCWLAAVRTGRSPGTAAGSRRLWMLVAVFMTFLCLNKQLDLQSLLTDIGRVLSWRHGWYGERREYQKLFVFALLGGSGLATVFVLILYRSFWRRHLLLGLGLSFLATFIAVRAVSFHHVDVFLRWSPGGVRMNWALELGGIALIALAACIDYIAPQGLRRKHLAGRH